MNAADVLAVLEEGRPLVDVNIEDTLCLHEIAIDDQINKHTIIENCDLASLDAKFCLFERPVILQNVRVSGDASFFSCCFFLGLHISDSEFSGYLDFQCGGHNKGENAIIFERTIFQGFVNFFDCQFEGPFVLRDCRFNSGTNLMGNKGRPYEVLFEILPVIEETTGEITQDSG